MSGSPSYSNWICHFVIGFPKLGRPNIRFLWRVFLLQPFIAKMEAIQSGYVKRCPCLYHQQQDQREREERQANLQLLNALGSFHCGPQGQAVGGAATSLADNTSIDEPAPGKQFVGRVAAPCALNCA